MSPSATPDPPDNDIDLAITDLQVRLEELSERVRRQRWLTLLTTMTSVLTVIVAVIVFQSFIRATERKFCAVLGLQIGTAAPPTTERGRIILTATQGLYDSLGCHTKGSMPTVTPGTMPTPR